MKEKMFVEFIEKFVQTTEQVLVYLLIFLIVFLIITWPEIFSPPKRVIITRRITFTESVRATNEDIERVRTENELMFIENQITLARTFMNETRNFTNRKNHILINHSFTIPKICAEPA